MTTTLLCHRRFSTTRRRSGNVDGKQDKVLTKSLFGSKRVSLPLMEQGVRANHSPTFGRLTARGTRALPRIRKEFQSGLGQPAHAPIRPPALILRTACRY
jgi:hypothetical protein